MKLPDIFARFKGLVKRPPIDLVEGRYWEATVTPDDKAQRVYTYNASQADLLMRATGYVHICTVMNATYCASVPVRLYTKNGAKGRKLAGKRLNWLRNGVRGKAAAYADNADGITEVMDHPALAMLSNPNFSDTGIEFRRLLFYFLDNPGNAYIQHDATETAPPKNLLQLYPQWVMPVIGDNGIEGYRYGRNQTSQEVIPSSNVIQFRHLPSPQNPWLGVGCLNSSTVEADIYASAIIFEQSFWNNGARPDFAVKMPAGSTADQVKQVEAMMQRKHQGVRKGGKPLIATDVEVTPLQWSPREMEYGDGMDRMRRTICNAFGVPLAMLEMNDSALGDGGGRMFQSRTQYLSQTIKPRMDSFCEKLTENFLPLFGLEPGDYWFAADNPDPENEDSEWARYRANTDVAILAINETRAEFGYDPIEGGDELRYKGVPLSKMGQTPAAVSTETPPPEPPQKKSIDRTVYARAMTAAGEGSCECGCKGKKDATATEPDAYAGTEEAQARLEQIMRNFYEAIDPLTFDKRKEAKELRDDLIIVLLLLFRDGYESGVARLRDAGFTGPIPAFADDAKEVTAFVDNYIPKLTRTITNTVAETITAETLKAQQAGLTPTEVQDAVKEKVREMALYAPERVAETETVRSFNGGTLDAWTLSEGVEYVEWVTREDERVCPFCNELHGIRVKVDEPFADLGHTVEAVDDNGQTVFFVNDYAPMYAPPAHPFCRCKLVPVLKDQA